MRIFSPDPIDAEELVSPLEPPVPVRHAPGDDPGDVDGRVLLLAAHHIEAQPLLGLGQLHHAGVGVTLGSREGSNCGLGSCAGPNIALKVLGNWKMGIMHLMSGDPSTSTVSYTCSYTSLTAFRNSDWRTF